MKLAAQLSHARTPGMGAIVFLVAAFGPALGWSQVVWDNGSGDYQWGTAANWSTNTVPTAASNVRFNATDDDATVSDISLGANRSANNLTFNNVNDSFSLVNGSGSRTLTLTSGDITRTTGSSGTQTLDFATLALGGAAAMNIGGAGQLTINAAIVNSGGSRALTKSGAGILELAGANTFSGGTTLTAGSLQLGHDSALGTGTATLRGGTIAAVDSARTIGNAVTIGGNFMIAGSQDLTFTGNINLGGATRTITVNNTGTTTFAGAVTEPWYSGLTKAGTGNLVLSGDNSFTARATVNAGTLTLAHDHALGATGTWGNAVASGATLALTNNITVTEGQFTLRGAGVGGGGALRNVSGDNVLAAAVTLGASTAFNADSGSLAVTGQMNLGSGSLTTEGAGNITLSGALTNSGGITHAGPGTLTLGGTAANSFSGTLAVQDGTVALAKTAGVNAIGGGAVVIGDGAGGAGSAALRLEAGNQIADYAGLVTVNADGVLQVNDFTESINTLGGTGLVDLTTSGYLTVGINSGSSSFGGSLAGTGTLEKAGSGTLTFTSDLDFAGTLKLSGGTLALAGVDVSAGTLLVTGNSIIDFGGISTFSLGQLTISAGVTLTIQNWADATDYFFTQNWSGATFDLTGAAPMNQVTFDGFAAGDTKWQEYDKQITPVPEPSLYGALLLAAAAGLLARRRLVRRPAA